MKLGEIVEKPISGEWGDEDLDGVGVPVLRTTNFTNEGVLNLDSVVTRLIAREKCEKKYLRFGDIIIEKSGGSDKQPVGRVVFYDGLERQFLFNNFTATLRVKENLLFDKKFLFYVLYAAYRRGGTEPYQNKTTGIRNLQLQRYLNELEVPAPPLAEQERIAAELDAVVATLKKRQAQLAELNVLVEARFVELFGDPATNPKGWPPKAIKTLFDLVSRGKQPAYIENSFIAVVNQACIYNDFFKFQNLKYFDPTSNKKTLEIQEGDILVNSTGTGTLGRCNIFVPTDAKTYVIDSHVTLLRPSKVILPLFFKVFFLAQPTQERFYADCVSGSTNQIELSKEKFLRFEIPLPPLELQERFAAEVERVEALKTTVRAGIAETQTLFDALTQRYFG